MIKYLLGDSVETDKNKKMARLQSINHETYINFCNQNGNEYNQNYTTIYAFPLIEKMVLVYDELGNPVMEEGFHKEVGVSEFAIKIETDSNLEDGKYYNFLFDGHKVKLKDKEGLKKLGWFNINM